MGRYLNFPYLSLRLLRRFCPDWLARPLLSNDRLPPSILFNACQQYLSLLTEFKIPVAGRSIVELGPGAYNLSALGLLTQGAEKIVFIEPSRHRPHPIKLKERLQHFWGLLPEPKTPDFATLWQDIQTHHHRVEYHNAHAEKTGLSPDSVDIILSRSVMEHVRNMPLAFEDQWRILKPGGAFVHFIDLRDHFFRYPFEMLTVPTWLWEKGLTGSGNSGYQNRLRTDDYAQLAKQAGFHAVRFLALSRAPEAYRLIKKHLHPHFQGRPDEVMNITVLALSGVKA
ncbi:MAG: hypothetical protein A2293_15170 [Elusimicrobia bacterium RIFOXYB2_FULL_49_7]|nr:MAG: hypothetical protein A2293_15170 [Elusimicrobia bacterium RIFOXYB2_FULL_49_7]